ncbi:MAG: hypothetical protein HQ582_02605 [Planctomycetes bacterium]|nr:hypothetical protein [Planctomycetota bacterium]
MRENEAPQGTSGEDPPTPRTQSLPSADTSQPVPGPHFTTHAPHVLARVPDLACADVEGEQPPFSGKEGRMLSSGLSMKILAGAGGLLLLAALALPFLFSASDFAEPDETDTTSVWQPEQPAPTASLAPSWGGASDGTVNWQLPTTAPGAAGPDTPSIPAWNEDSQSADPNAYSQGQPMDTPALPHPWSEQPWADQSGPAAWEEQPPTQAWIPKQDNVPSAGQPHWELPADQPHTPSWGERVNVATGPSPHDQTRPSPPSESVPQRYRESTPSWSEQPRTPSWEVPPYRADGQTDAQRSAIASQYTRQTTSDDTARYSEIRGSAYPPESPGTGRREPVEYRTADARGAVTIGDRARYRTGAGYDGAAPTAGHPPISSVPSRYSAASVPAADYAPTVYPTAGRSAAAASSHGASAMPGYGAGAQTRLPEPGVARFQGGIEKPTGSNPYDRARPSIY